MSGISLGRVTTILLAGRTLGYALSLLNSVVLARTLGVERLGAYAYAMGVTALFGLLPNMGISTVVTRTIAREPDAGAGMVASAIRLQMLLAVGVLILVPSFAAVLPGQPVPLGYVALAAAQLAVGTMSWPYLAVLAGRARYDRITVAELASGLAGTATLIGAAALHGGVAAFLWAHILAAGLAAVGARWIATPFISVGGRERLPLSTLLREATPFGATAAVQGLYTRLDSVMLGQMASRTTLGLYSAAYKAINLAVYFGSTVAGPLFPLMAQEPRLGTPLAYRRAVRALGVTGPAMALTFSGLAAPLLHLLFGADYAAAAPILVILAWSAAANWLYAPLGIALQARGHERLWLASLILGTVVNAMGNLWAIPRWGGVGAAGVTLASEVVLLAWGGWFVWRKLSIPPSGGFILAGLVSTGIGVLVLGFLRGPAGPWIATAAGLSAYGAMAFLFRIVTVEDVSDMTAWIREALAVRFPPRPRPTQG
jgi:O-antigen/teichoic acid export membrane protein